MIKLIDVTAKPPKSTPEGQVATVLGPESDGTRVHVEFSTLDPHKALTFASSDQTQLVYVLDGDDARIAHTRGGQTADHAAGRRSGIYLEPGETATVEAASSPLRLLNVRVPKHIGRPTDSSSPAGYFFWESELRSLVDAKSIRERTFWVNKETGLSDSWDLQLGRMEYAPGGYSPRHVHRGSDTSDITPEHFYLIESGTATVEHDSGSLPVGPGTLVLIPAGEWHRLVASESGLDYIEFQAPFDFVTTMDHDPLGKNWYIKGTDDGTGQPELWVQS
jgi:mannose-6-phosphate isomerase-like protein (cupin superfamily)